VGGGNRNVRLSNIPLVWMYGCAQRTGLVLDPLVVERFARKRDPSAPISVHAIDPVKNKPRDIRPNDWVHVSVSPRKDSGGRLHNNPPPGLHTMDDDGVVR
jgi:hypothetical protein